MNLNHYLKTAKKVNEHNLPFDPRIREDLLDLQDYIHGDNDDRKALEKAIVAECVEDLNSIIRVLSKYQKEDKAIQRNDSVEFSEDCKVSEKVLASRISQRSNLISVLHGIVDLLKVDKTSKRIEKYPWYVSYTMSSDFTIASSYAAGKQEIMSFLRFFFFKRDDDKILYKKDYLLKYDHIKLDIIEFAIDKAIYDMALTKHRKKIRPILPYLKECL